MQKERYHHRSLMEISNIKFFDNLQLPKRSVIKTSRKEFNRLLVNMAKSFLALFIANSK